MSLLSTLLYDRCMSSVERACLRDWRKALISQVGGHVLEIGAGTGANLDFYPDTVRRLVLTEPDQNMRKRLKARVSGNGRLPAVVTAWRAEKIETAAESFDAVTASLVLCSVSRLETALLEVRRVLKPKGRLLFLEHVAAGRGTARRRWQDRITPLWRSIAGNCHLNRDTEKAILAAGFALAAIRREDLNTIAPIVKPTIRGIAVKMET